MYGTWWWDDGIEHAQYKLPLVDSKYCQVVNERKINDAEHVELLGAIKRSQQW